MKPVLKMTVLMAAMMIGTVAWRLPIPQFERPVIVTGGATTKSIMPPSNLYPTEKAFIKDIQRIIPANGDPITWEIQPDHIVGGIPDPETDIVEPIYLTEKQWQVYHEDFLRRACAGADDKEIAAWRAQNDHTKASGDVDANDVVLGAPPVLDAPPPARGCITNIYLVDFTWDTGQWTWGWTPLNGGTLTADPYILHQWDGDAIMVGVTCTNTVAPGGTDAYSYFSISNCPPPTQLSKIVVQFDVTQTNCCHPNISFNIKNPADVVYFTDIPVLPQCTAISCLGNETNCVPQ